MFQTKVVENIRTHVLCSANFFFENRAVCENMLENIVERGRSHDNMAHGHGVLDT